MMMLAIDCPVATMTTAVAAEHAAQQEELPRRQTLVQLGVGMSVDVVIGSGRSVSSSPRP